MTHSQHMSGPWMVAARQGKTPEIKAGQYQVAVVGIGSSTVEEEVATALLIAAAPALLEACKAAGAIHHTDQVGVNLRRAIALAEGGRS